MTSGHFIYIPMILTVGVVIGFILGGRAARDAFDLQARRDAERAAAKEKREARRRAGGQDASGASGDAGGPSADPARRGPG